MQSSRPARPPPPNTRTRDEAVEQKFAKVDECYNSSMCHVTNGLVADEDGNTSAAIKHYVNALCCLEMGIGIELPRSRDRPCIAAWQRQANMAQALENVRSRLYELQQGPPEPTAPSYSEGLPEGHSSLMASSSGSPAFPSNSSAMNGLSTEDAVELLNIPNGVQLYCVFDGSTVNVAPPSYPSSLQILLFDNENSSQPGASNSSRPPAFIQVGEWVYPLIPGQSPVLKCVNGAYMFPNITATDTVQPGSVGLVISSALEPTYREMFENILENFAVLQIQDHAPDGEPVVDLSASVPCNRNQEQVGDMMEKDEETSLSQKVAYGIGKGAGWLSWGLIKGAEVTTNLIKQGAQHVQKNIKPDEKPAEVNPNLQKGLYYTNEAAKITVKVSAAMVKGLTIVAGEVAKSVAPHIKSYADSVLPSSVTEKQDESSESTMDGIINVAGAGLAGFGTVWTSLEHAGLAVAKSVSSATVSTVQLKYGAEAGEATGNAMGAGVNLCRTAFNIDNLGIKAIAKRTAKETGKEFLKGYVKEKKSTNIEGVTAGDDDMDVKTELKESKAVKLKT
uniref:Spartin n=1 Tax=Phallusia mammillata TaxID=59560 RepID=A0A6F9DU41_9ASCI|nr:spartin [Phallusia mammillata]